MDARVRQLLQCSYNRFCADCGEKGPRWCSVNLGVVICAECAGMHRRMGTHISFVQSCTLDRWKDAWVERLSEVGNAVAAARYEASLPAAWARPCAQGAGGDRIDTASAAHLERFIRAKYEWKVFEGPGHANGESQQDLQDQAVGVKKFFVLLRRIAGEPFGIAPSKRALRRGVLQISALGPSTPATAWNEAQQNSETQLRVGDCISSVNDIEVRRTSASHSAVEQLQHESQALLVVWRVAVGNVTDSYNGETVCASDASEDAGRRHGGYLPVLLGVYGLFNPSKLLDVHRLLANHKGSELKLFTRICAKYATDPEDWFDILHCLARLCNSPADLTREAEASLSGQDGQEVRVLENFCRRLLDQDVEPMTANASAQLPCKASVECYTSDDSPGCLVAGYRDWPQLNVELKRLDTAAPLGIVHDRPVLQHSGVLLVRRVLADSPAGTSGLRVGDVIESIGGEDASTAVASLRPSAVQRNAAQDSVNLLLSVRRPLCTSP